MDFPTGNTINKRKVETGTEQPFKRRLVPLVGHVPSVREDAYSVPPTRNVSPASGSLFCSETLSPLESDCEKAILEGIAEAMASMPLDQPASSSVSSPSSHSLPDVHEYMQPSPSYVPVFTNNNDISPSYQPTTPFRSTVSRGSAPTDSLYPPSPRYHLNSPDVTTVSRVQGWIDPVSPAYEPTQQTGQSSSEKINTPPTIASDSEPDSPPYSATSPCYLRNGRDIFMETIGKFMKK